MLRTALTLLADMLAAYAYSFTLGGGWDYSLYMIGVNAIAAVIVLRHWAGKWQTAIGVCFIFQIGTDTGRVASEFYFGMSDDFVVYWMTTALAFVQLVFLGGWYASERLGYFDRRFDHPLSIETGRRGLVQ